MVHAGMGSAVAALPDHLPKARCIQGNAREGCQGKERIPGRHFALEMRSLTACSPNDIAVKRQEPHEAL